MVQRQFPVRIDTEVLSALDERALRDGLSRNALVGVAIRTFLTSETGPSPVLAPDAPATQSASLANRSGPPSDHEHEGRLIQTSVVGALGRKREIRTYRCSVPGCSAMWRDETPV